ncbi:UPF0220 protein [Glarea lozoyensis ATCC 20868]|uniref:UPF0220 protein n=1 Tax=Glarea lozoyensis (strain ATCC 20868 / MF5171) TaxID=1116229 RepID=S3DPZ2_GLAL2|nr:UPF0220 protein [Glarea lozoyensis ATCC 20868]EPE34131.1 UPF0220 protein [Glarea lozoyensis ATCC 20868]
MPERRQATATTATHPRTGVRRNLFHHQLSRRPTTSSTSTSAETLHLDANENDDMDNSDIVIRNQNGEFEIGDPPMQSFDESEEGGGDTIDDEKERQRLKEAVKHHRDRNRAPSEPAELLEAVRASLRTKVMNLAEDNWMYEPEEEAPVR